MASLKKPQISQKRLAELAVLSEQSAIAQEQPAAEVTLNFRVPYRCIFGQHLAVVGAADALGRWDVSQAPPMQWGEGDVWTATVKMPYQQTLEYKYVVMQNSAVLRWEEGPNHGLRLPGGGVSSIKILDQWEQFN